MKIPKSKRQKVVRNLRVGEFGYITPMGMVIDLEGECFVEKGTPVFNSKMDGFDLRIKRVESGFIAYIYEIKVIWMETTIVDLNFRDSCDSEEKVYFESTYGPVVGFGKNPEQKITKEDLEEELKSAILKEDYAKAEKINSRIKTFKE